MLILNRELAPKTKIRVNHLYHQDSKPQVLAVCPPANSTSFIGLFRTELYWNAKCQRTKNAIKPQI